MNPITILLADDHQIVRQGMNALLAQEPGLAVVGEASDGIQTLELAERLHPDVLLLDLMMPGLNGLEVLHQLEHRAPTVRAIVLSMYGDEMHVVHALHNGAAGYVLKDSCVQTLLAAVRVVAAGGRYLCPLIVDRVAAYEARPAGAPLVDSYETLTGRERQVLQLVVEGYTNAQIAARLSISRRTVETHRANGMHKLGLHSHTDLVRFALRRGILPPDG